MAIDEVVGEAWTGKYDDPGMPVVPGASRTRYLKFLAELIELATPSPTATRKPSEKLHAARKHWGLSEVTNSDSVVETHDPNNQHQAMGRTLYDLAGVPGCLDQGFIDRLLGTTVKPFATEPLNIS